jgi:hypothetical protein
VGVNVSVMHVEVEEPLSPGSKGLESRAREPSPLRARGVYGYLLPSKGPDAYVQHLTPGKATGFV